MTKTFPQPIQQPLSPSDKTEFKLLGYNVTHHSTSRGRLQLVKSPTPKGRRRRGKKSRSLRPPSFTAQTEERETGETGPSPHLRETTHRRRDPGDRRAPTGSIPAPATSGSQNTYEHGHKAKAVTTLRLTAAGTAEQTSPHARSAPRPGNGGRRRRRERRRLQALGHLCRLA